MKIAVDISLLAEPGSGTWSYVKYLVEHLAETDKANQYYLYSLFFRNYREKLGRMKILRQPNFSFKPFRYPSSVSRFFLRRALPWSKLFHDCQVIHMPGYTVLPPVKAKVAVTVHGLAPLVCSSAYPYKIRKEYNFFLNWVKEKADVVIAVSESVRNDLINMIHIPQEKIRIVREAASGIFQRVNDDMAINTVLEKYKIKKPFILSVSVLSPIKNLLNVIYAYKKYLADNPKSPYKLVVVGQKGWFYEDIFKAVVNLDLESKVIFTGAASQEELVCIYNAADLFLYPSLYEGFGIPVLEAMGCGVPVVTSNNSALTEVAGDAALLVDSQKIDEITQAIIKVLGDEKLKKEMAEKGLKQIAQFSWSKTARETLAVYNEIV